MRHDTLLDHLLANATYYTNAEGEWMQFNCDFHGPYTDVLGLPTSCEQCNAIGFIVRRTLAREDFAAKEQELGDQVRAAVDACGDADRGTFDYQPLPTPKVIRITESDNKEEAIVGLPIDALD